MAQSEADVAATNMRLAATLCLQHARTPSQFEAAFAAAGFSVRDGLDAGVYVASAPGVGVLMVDPGTPEGFCRVESGLVSIALARVIGDAIVAEYPAGAFQPGWPGETASAPPPLCQGYVAWDARPIITITYESAGNDADCVDRGNSAIVVD
ncbi:MAG: hypothetical protein AAGF88_03720 [Pseudomonadota bacterium]